jgi:hypothetical protein
VTRYAGLVRALLRPYVRKLEAGTIPLGDPSDRTRAVTAQFGPLDAHYRCMRDDRFVQGLAAAIDTVLD